MLERWNGCISCSFWPVVTLTRHDRLRPVILHSRYLSGSTSGENRVVNDEAKLLAAAGHDVAVWSPMVNGASAFRLGVGAIWSPEASGRIAELVDRYRPDVVHCHNLFPLLSPATVRAASVHVPVVMTLHNFRLLCLPATLIRDGKVCEECVGRSAWRGVAHRCYRGSALGSGALALSLSLHRALRTFNRVQLFLAVSDFVKRKHVEAGMSAGRIRIKSNFSWPTRRRDGTGEYFLYLGRLTSEKGVGALLDVWRPALGRLVVVGDGPEAEHLCQQAPSGVEFRGAVPAAEVPEVVRRAKALVVPSKWYEPASRSVLEAYASGVPVVASRIGGLPEVVEHERSGLLIPPSDTAAWGQAIERLLDDSESERLGDGAYRLWQERYTPEQGLKNLEAAYRAAMQ
jgi:glycosyltransferase involved in cell wall biosynthesis